VYGDYPKTMKEKVGSRLPLFTEEQSAMIRGATDFITVNHYTSVYISDRSDSAETGRPLDVYGDMSVAFRCKFNFKSVLLLGDFYMSFLFLRLIKLHDQV
jgi:beta-glucosidase